VVTVFFSTSDSLGTEVRDDWDEARVEKNGELKHIEVRKTLEVADTTRIRGWLMNHTSQEGTWQKHARISNISLKLEEEKVKKQ